MASSSQRMRSCPERTLSQDGLVLRCPSCTVADEVQYVVDTALQRRRQGGLGQASSSSKACTNGSRNIFDQKTDKSSSDLYFTYYGK